MNLREAKEKISFFTGESKAKTLDSMANCFHAQGYLEAYSQMEPLVEAFKKRAVRALDCFGNNTKQPHACNCGSKEALSQWEKLQEEKR